MPKLHEECAYYFVANERDDHYTQCRAQRTHAVVSASGLVHQEGCEKHTIRRRTISPGSIMCTLEELAETRKALQVRASLRKVDPTADTQRSEQP